MNICGINSLGGRLNPLRLTAFASSPEGGAFLLLTGRCLKLPLSGELARRKA